MTELPADPREQEIFLRALRHYSDSCQPPELIAECPFSVDEGPGQRGCGEECMDLLAAHNAPPSTEEIKLGNGISFIRNVRPRSRRVHPSHMRAYDAREVYLTDKATKPLQRWSLASVLQALVEDIRTAPPLAPSLMVKRREDIYELIHIIGERGLKFDVQVLPYLQNSVIGPVAVTILKRDDEKRAQEIKKVMDRIVAWANTANLMS